MVPDEGGAYPPPECDLSPNHTLERTAGFRLSCFHKVFGPPSLSLSFGVRDTRHSVVPS